MKSKYLDIKKLKQPFDSQQYDKKSRRQTKPNKIHKICLGQQNQTQSENNGYSKKYQQKQRMRFPIKNYPKQVEKAPKSGSKVRYQQTQSSSSQTYELFRDKQLQIARKKSVNPARKSSEKPHHADFIGQLNSYLQELKRSKLDLKQNQGKFQNQTMTLNKTKEFRQNQELQKTTIINKNQWQQKIKKEKSINRNLQKCIIQIQKVLWDRNDKLELLQDEIRKSCKHGKQNNLRKNNDHDKNNLSKTIFLNRNFAEKTQPLVKHKNKHIVFHEQQSPLNQFSKISSRGQKVEQCLQTYSDTERQSSATFKQKRPRRKTQTPINLQRILQKTLHNKDTQKTRNQKSYSKFQKQRLYDI